MVSDVYRVKQKMGGYVMKKIRTGLRRFVPCCCSPMDRTLDRFASLELRIPSTVMGEAINSLKSMGKVANERKSGQDVTEEYIDVEARIKALKVEEERLLELVKKGTKLEEILQVERELTRVRGEIERAQGRIKFLDNKIEYATIHLQLEKAKTLDNESPQSATSRTWQGLVDDLADLLNFGKEALIWQASNLFTLLLLVTGGYIAYRKLKPVYDKRTGGPKGPTPPGQ
ncbi:DUF4349 domain-containing protein [Effusibacillus consociatus]|uniref:DUF4349 domain-containing protein n=1 Tax=Effusibacillus consociatus TaxID=1117041 RepID=A0ABV9PX43_9BACL